MLHGNKKYLSMQMTRDDITNTIRSATKDIRPVRMPPDPIILLSTVAILSITAVAIVAIVLRGS